MAEKSKALNTAELGKIKPFEAGKDLVDRPAVPVSGLVSIEQERAMAEVKGAIVLAKQFPRDQRTAIERIMIACQRPGLANQALYDYARGGTDITGATIRLAEEIARNWGNLQYGIQELEQREGESTVEAFCWDMETNVRVSRKFQVKHIRYTRTRTYGLDDPRDIYETVANQGARRLRACILENIPGDVVDDAVEQCEKTLKATEDLSPESIKKLVKGFEKYGVTQEMIEKRIQRKLDAITAAQLIGLRKVWNSLKDGMSKPEAWFEMAPAGTTEPPPPPPPGEAGSAGAAKVVVLSKKPCPELAGSDRDGQQENEEICKECRSRLGCPAW